MSEIPESLKLIAIAAIRDGREGCERANRCKCEVGLGECDAKVAAIAYAILAERERCAAIADARADAYAEIANKHDGTPIGESNTMRCGAAAAIASAIRGNGHA